MRCAPVHDRQGVAIQTIEGMNNWEYCGQEWKFHRDQLEETSAAVSMPEKYACDRCRGTVHL